VELAYHWLLHMTECACYAGDPADPNLVHTRLTINGAGMQLYGDSVLSAAVVEPSGKQACPGMSGQQMVFNTKLTLLSA
jgi:hypothetical protein